MDDVKVLLESVLQRVVQETGLSPPVVLSLGVLLATLLALLLFSRGSRNPGPPPKGAPASAAPAVKRELGEITLEELAQYNGDDPAKPICVALKGVIYDVSRARHLYGPDGGYSCFAGKEASRALAKMSMDAADATGDLTGLSASELDSLDEWVVQYQFKYDVVGKLRPSAAAPAAAGAAGADGTAAAAADGVAGDAGNSSKED